MLHLMFRTAPPTMTTDHPAWLRALVHEHDIEPKAYVAATALEIALSPRKRVRRSKTPRPPTTLPPFDKDLECKHCGKEFRRVCNYREHQRVHSNEYKFRCSVQGCDRKFMWRSSIQAHLRSHQAKLDRRRRISQRVQRPHPELAPAVTSHGLPHSGTWDGLFGGMHYSRAHACLLEQGWKSAKG